MKKLAILPNALIVTVLLILATTAGTKAQTLNQFQNGERADAEEINENFSALKQAIQTQAGCTASQDGSDVRIVCGDGSLGTVSDGGSVTTVVPYAGTPANVLDCTSLTTFVEKVIELKLNGDNVLGYLAAAEFPTMDADVRRDVLATLQEILSTSFLNSDYSNRYFQALITEKLTAEAVEHFETQCRTEMWFERLETSAFARLVSDSATPVELTMVVSGGGEVTSFPSALNCSGVCRADFPNGEEAIVRATPALGNEFIAWSGACSGTTPACSFVVEADQTISASFTNNWLELSENIFPVVELEQFLFSEVYLPYDATQIEVEMSGGTDGDPVLAVTSLDFYNQTGGQFQCVVSGGESVQTVCSTEQLAPLNPGGGYFVGVYGQSRVTNVTLVVRYR